MKGQITRHEWEETMRSGGWVIHKCKHCPLEKHKLYEGLAGVRNQYKYGNTWIEELPKCITRKKPEDESNVNKRV